MPCAPLRCKLCCLALEPLQLGPAVLHYLPCCCILLVLGGGLMVVDILCSALEGECFLVGAAKDALRPVQAGYDAPICQPVRTLRLFLVLLALQCVAWGLLMQPLGLKGAGNTMLLPLQIFTITLSLLSFLFLQAHQPFENDFKNLWKFSISEVEVTLEGPSKGPRVSFARSPLGPQNLGFTSFPNAKYEGFYVDMAIRRQKRSTDTHTHSHTHTQEEETEVKAHSPAEGPAPKSSKVSAHSIAEMRRPSALGFAASFL